MQQIQLFIGGSWRDAGTGEFISVINPVNEQVIGQIGKASDADIEDAVQASAEGFAKWKAVPAIERAAILNRAAAIMRERGEAIAHQLTIEHGKPIGESRGEVGATADTIEWNAQEARRIYGRVIPAAAPACTNSRSWSRSARSSDSRLGTSR